MPNALSTSSGESNKPPFHTSAVHQPPLAPAQIESSSFSSLPQLPPQISVAQSAPRPCLTPYVPVPAPSKESISSMPNASPAVSSQSTSQPSAPAQHSSILPSPQPPPGGSIISSSKASSAPSPLSSQSNQPLVQSSTATTQPPPAPVHKSVQISSATVPQTSLDPKTSIIPAPQSVVGTSPATPVSSSHPRTRPFTPEESGGGVVIPKPQTTIYPSLASTTLTSGTTSISRTTSVSGTTSISSPSSVDSAIAGATAGSVIIASPPISNVAIISSTIGGAIIVSLLGFLAYTLLRRRLAKRDEEGDERDSPGSSNYTGGLQGASTGNHRSGQNEISAFGLQYGKSHGGPNPTTVGAPPISSGMAGLRNNSTRSQTETEVIMAEMDRINALRSPDLNRPLAPAQQMNGMGNMEQRIDVPTNGYYGKRDSDWSVPTSSSGLYSSGVYSIPQGGEMVIGTRPPDPGDPGYERQRSPGGGPTIATPTAAWIPSPGLEQRVPQDASRDSYSTMNSDMFEKLLYDVQSQPF
ncbi:hypothetical protein LZ554_002740 [Drepanopeziza brunnea f. sp. 'monogermtubi']|nr:hypothetical protein LZ554_002740 [Drepanopeziza brunnea f. sp. 'monogermtubi']